MNLLKHILTEEENKYVESCLDLINSHDSESFKLGISLFCEKFGNYRFPMYKNGRLELLKIFPSKGFLCKNVIRFLFRNGYCYY